MKNKLLSLISFIFLFAVSTQSLISQSEEGRLAFGFNYGAVKYWGEFTDNQFWFGGDLFFRYNILSELSIQATAGLSNIRYKTDNEVIGKYPDYFGNDAEKGDIYPGTDDTHIQDKNSVRINSYELYLTYNLFSSEPFVPFIFAGGGLINFEPKAGDTGFDGPLPNNSLGNYDKNQFVFPAGIGFEAYVTDNLVINGRGTFRWTFTDYLDDHAVEGSDDDVFMTFGLGVSYYILGDPDYDDDGLTNSEEEKIGTDPKNPDSDGDNLIDGEEVNKHYTDPLNQDSDNDNLGDYREVRELETSPIKADTDADGLPDGQEIARKTDPVVADSDNDRLLDGDEVNKHSTDPLDKDTDGDNLIDGDEVMKYSTDPKANDTDGDGLADGAEVNEYKTNPAKEDTDGDGLADGLEINQYKTDPNAPDSDNDGLSDGQEINEHGSDPLKKDSDGDDLTDGDEVRKYKTNPVSEDTDRDQLNDGLEVLKYKTDPAKEDTDNDGLKDGREVTHYNTDPNVEDTDGDLINDGPEVKKWATNPTKKDTDEDLLDDGTEINKTRTDPTNPDTDGDKIIDGNDDCPHIAGKPSEEEGENGCPQAPKIGTKTDFPNIHFKYDSDEFNFDFPGTHRDLKKLLEYVNQCEGLGIMIEGHASQEGTKEYNQDLSERRAQKVKEWLMKQGVKPDKIDGAIGYGETQPKVPLPPENKLRKMSKEEIEEIYEQNRRITVEVVETCGDEAQKKTLE